MVNQRNENIVNFGASADEENIPPVPTPQKTETVPASSDVQSLNNSLTEDSSREVRLFYWYLNYDRFQLFVYLIAGLASSTPSSHGNRSRKTQSTHKQFVEGLGGVAGFTEPRENPRQASRRVLQRLHLEILRKSSGYKLDSVSVSNVLLTHIIFLLFKISKVNTSTLWVVKFWTRTAAARWFRPNCAFPNLWSSPA